MANKRRFWPKHLKFLSSYFLSILLLILGVALIFWSSRSRFLSYNLSTKSEQVTVDAIAGKPQKLYVPKMAKILDVSDGKVEGDRWTVSDKGVSYLTSSSLPTNGGNTVIYGHNRKEVLGNLVKVNKGDAIYLILDDGEIVSYKVSETKQVKPTEVKILEETDYARLTIYTCSGFLDQARFVVFASRQS